MKKNQTSRRLQASMVALAMSGLFVGLTTGCSKKESSSTGTTPSATQNAAEKHACKGMNQCKGQGGCSTSAAGCAGKNACKGQGGCATVEKHSCKGQNACKSMGGCNTGDNGCAGKNSCKGKGGCAVPVKH